MVRYDHILYYMGVGLVWWHDIVDQNGVLIITACVDYQLNLMPIHVYSETTILCYKLWHGGNTFVVPNMV